VTAVTQLNIQGELSRFFDFCYGKETGYAYSPTKHPTNNEDFVKHFFKWPEQKDTLIEHCLRERGNREVYYSPGLFDKPDATKESFKGSNFVWAEWDGNAPNSFDGVPPPSLRIRSSRPGYEHAYWKLEHFEKDPKLIANLSKRLAYHLNGDRSVWNENRVLRPPGTVHHESGNQVYVVSWSDHKVPPVAFKDLPDIIGHVPKIKIDSLPQIEDIVATYKWEVTDWKFFRKTSAQIKAPKDGRPGSRSQALVRLAFTCIEMGMKNEEVFSVILNADRRWKKYEKRPDQYDRLVGIIEYCRGDKEARAERTEKEDLKSQLVGFRSFVLSDIRPEWVVPNLLLEKGMALLSGPPKRGKSLYSLRQAINLALGRRFLIWDAPRKPQRSVFVSMEMNDVELKLFVDQIKGGLSNEELDILEENLILWPVGSSIRIANTPGQDKLAEIVEETGVNGLFLDSLGVGIGGKIRDVEVLLTTFDFLARLRRDTGVFVWFIHHSRKAQVGNKDTSSLDDIYGDQYIAGQATSLIGLHRNEKEPKSNDVICQGIRSAAPFEPFTVKFGPHLDFLITTDTAIPGEDFNTNSSAISDFGKFRI